MNPLDNNSLLSQLKDVHAPDAISQWPWAFGWWILIILTLISISSLSLLLIKKHLKYQWKREALSSFLDLKNRYSQEPSLENVTAINRLLKQAYASATSDRTSLHFTGKQWADCLFSVKKKKRPVLSVDEIVLLSEGIYSNQHASLSNESIKRLETWIRALR